MFHVINLFFGFTNLHVSQLIGQLFFYYTESLRSTYNGGNMHWIEFLHTLTFHSKWLSCGMQYLYYDVTALVTAVQCGETWRGDMKICLPRVHMTFLDHISLFVISILWGMIIFLAIVRLLWFCLRLNDRGHIVFVLSVWLTLTFTITFERWDIESSYLACILN